MSNNSARIKLEIIIPDCDASEIAHVIKTLNERYDGIEYTSLTAEEYITFEKVLEDE